MAEVEAVARGLAELDEDDLTAQLGAVSQYVEANPEEVSVNSIEDIPVPRGAFDDLFKAGLNVFTSISPKAYNVLCSPIGGKGELAAELDKLMSAKTTEAAAKMTGLLTPVLVGSLGLPQSVAVVVGSLIVKKAAKGTSDYVCENWKANLSSAASSAESPHATESSANG
ncbi:MAG: hypothetical protein KME15_13960 [Drouetiella hepatica Uher 2000/2452]|jgi:hypothetical protein|uniref:Uncharacterized protein n=1 Tax=Drouetiella hepatica Uher 2000/2452 TaxID=904376 RepID=A0A951QE78_9CYAN|nr:hypothetical protein [Drouetiella hepatica Uher 2000/2452]